MKVSLFRNAALRGVARCRRRIAIARTPRVESLEDRKLPAILVLPITSVQAFTATITLPGPPGANTVPSVPVAGGNFLGTFNTTPLSVSYGLNPVLGTIVGVSHFSASETSNGTVYGTAVPNAGGVAWLLVHFGPASTTAIEQDALQAAIWRTEFGNDFQLDGVDNLIPIKPVSVNAEMKPIYLAELAALGSNTVPVSDVMWISPDSTATFSLSESEGLAALSAITPVATATFVTASANPAKKGHAVNFSVTVFSDQIALKPAIPLGTVVFEIDGQIKASVPLSNGKAVLNGIKLPVGTHTVTVFYIPLNANFAASQGQLIGGERVKR